jgi:hypothetical protein
LGLGRQLDLSARLFAQPHREGVGVQPRHVGDRVLGAGLKVCHGPLVDTVARGFDEGRKLFDRHLVASDLIGIQVDQMGRRLVLRSLPWNKDRRAHAHHKRAGRHADERHVLGGSHQPREAPLAQDHREPALECASGGADVKVHQPGGTRHAAADGDRLFPALGGGQFVGHTQGGGGQRRHGLAEGAYGGRVVGVGVGKVIARCGWRGRLKRASGPRCGGRVPERGRFRRRTVFERR